MRRTPPSAVTFVLAVIVVITVAMVTAGCGRKKAPIARPAPPVPTASSGAGAGGADTAGTRPPAPPAPIRDAPIVPPEPIRDEGVSSASLDELNRNSPLRPVFFELDSSDLTPEAQRILDANAALIRQNASWTVTIEGHCDERGTAEYNLALGERRALSARAYLVSLGLSADRLRTVSYGKEFPFDPGQTEGAWEKNRRAHFVITAK